MPPPAKVNANANSKEKATSMLQQEVTAEQQELKRPRHSTQFEVKVEEKVLPDHLAEGLDMIVVGINPGYSSALAGHHYAGPGNHFWKCLYLSGLVSRPMTAKDDANLLEECRIGFTNMVARTTRSSANLKRQELQAGALLLRAKLTRYRPLIAVFNGKGIYAEFVGRSDFQLGLQPMPLTGTRTRLFVMPSSSPRCAHWPRAHDKLPYYIALKNLRDSLLGTGNASLDERNLVFPSVANVRPTSGLSRSFSTQAPNQCQHTSEMSLQTGKEHEHQPIVTACTSKSLRQHQNADTRKKRSKLNDLETRTESEDDEMIFQVAAATSKHTQVHQKRLNGATAASTAASEQVSTSHQRSQQTTDVINSLELRLYKEEDGKDGKSAATEGSDDKLLRARCASGSKRRNSQDEDEEAEAVDEANKSNNRAPTSSALSSLPAPCWSLSTHLCSHSQNEQELLADSVRGPNGHRITRQARSTYANVGSISSSSPSRGKCQSSKQLNTKKKK